jgi:hypothetical protein
MRGHVGHLKRMSQKQFSSAMPDLFGAIQFPSRQRTGLARPASGTARHTPKLNTLSDRELAGVLGDLVREVQRRMTRDGGRKPAPELERALREAAPVFAQADPRGAKPSRERPESKGREVSETKRNAIRSALMAGVKPAQVARHFGVSLSTLRQIGSDPD